VEKRRKVHGTDTLKESHLLIVSLSANEGVVQGSSSLESDRVTPVRTVLLDSVENFRMVGTKLSISKETGIRRLGLRTILHDGVEIGPISGVNRQSFSVKNVLDGFYGLNCLGAEINYTRVVITFVLDPRILVDFLGFAMCANLVTGADASLCIVELTGL
jgi:hypothetical protein